MLSPEGGGALRGGGTKTSRRTRRLPKSTLTFGWRRGLTRPGPVSAACCVRVVACEESQSRHARTHARTHAHTHTHTHTCMHARTRTRTHLLAHRCGRTKSVALHTKKHLLARRCVRGRRRKMASCACCSSWLGLPVQQCKTSGWFVG